MYKGLRALVLFIALIQVTGCKEPYDPTLESGYKNYLIVEGFVNASGITSLHLSRSMKLDEKGIIKPEKGAALQIEGDDNTVYPLYHEVNGLYKSAVLDLAPGNKYRLRIKTASGSEYLSDYSSVRSSPDIQVSWSQQTNGLGIYVSTADPENQTKYYQWSYDETWEVRSFKRSFYGVRQTVPNLGVFERTPSGIEELFACWANARATNILTASTAALAEDRIDNYPLVFIPNGSDKLAVRYSILVKQYAIPREAYEFLELMRKNSEQMGSVFDPQPSAVRGNIYNVSDPEEPVIGFMVTASPVEKRIFITSAEAGDWRNTMECGEIYVPNVRDSLERFFRDDRNLIIDGPDDPNSSVPRKLGYFASVPRCLDCRLRGSTVKPSFW